MPSAGSGDSSGSSHHLPVTARVEGTALHQLPGPVPNSSNTTLFRPRPGTAASHHHAHRHHHTPSIISTHLASSNPICPTMSRRRQGSAGGQDSKSPYFPSHKDVVAGCEVFVTSCFQLGFLPKSIFVEAIRRDASAISPFLLACILGVSARFTSSLVQKYGSPQRATDNFLRLARMMVPAEMYEPSLERTQAFFLLAVIEWGNGDRDRSSVNMGVAARMASILRLHREESHMLPPDARPEHVIRAESARRTFWMIHSQENLHAAYSSTAPFPAEDITARLPCDETDFAFGRLPTSPRSVLPATAAAHLHPLLADSPSRCLFATLVQSHQLWGQVARRACRSDLKTQGAAHPWEEGSEYQVLTGQLRQLEAAMPDCHRWSDRNLRSWASQQAHLAYLSMVMVLRVSNIVQRRIYLDDILQASDRRATTPKAKSQPPEGFWVAMADELFADVAQLYEQVDAFAKLRHEARGQNKGAMEGFPANLVFCVYICGSLASYLWRYPQLCPRVAAAPGADLISLRCLGVLGELHSAWPTSARWHQGLTQIAGSLCASGAGERACHSSQGSGSSTSGGDSPPTPPPSGRYTLSGRKSEGAHLPHLRAAAPEQLAFEEGQRTPRAAVPVAVPAAPREPFIDPRLTATSSCRHSTYTPAEPDAGAGGLFHAAASCWGAADSGSCARDLAVCAAAQTAACAEACADADADAEVGALPNELFEAEMRTLLGEDLQIGWYDQDFG